jgi:hypothetical protein
MSQELASAEYWVFNKNAPMDITELVTLLDSHEKNLEKHELQQVHESLEKTIWDWEIQLHFENFEMKVSTWILHMEFAETEMANAKDLEHTKNCDFNETAISY